MKKFLALLLALTMVLSLAACGGNNTPAPTDAPVVDATDAPEAVTYVDPYADLREDYDALSEAIYMDELGEFYEAFEAAKAAKTVSEKYALMAIAEAKLMEAAVFLPLTAQGGNYAISRVAPNTASTTAWGNDQNRYHNVLVTTEPIPAAHRDELKAMWAELKGTGTWEASAKAFLE